MKDLEENSIDLWSLIYILPILWNTHSKQRDEQSLILHQNIKIKVVL